MEENVALDSSKQKQFVKSIKGIKKLIKKTNETTPEIPTLKPEDDKSSKRKRKERGLVYLSHIPHGFYENEMTQYFKQFGVVTNVRVIRSKRTGNSRGCAFVEFKTPAVAQIVAETMNNYLMGKRLIKAAYVPPEKQRPHAMRKHWNAKNNPGNDMRIKMRKAHNEDKDEAMELKQAKKLLSNLSKAKKKLSEISINYDFFTPVDIPEALIKVEKEVEIEEKKENVNETKIIKKKGKEQLKGKIKKGIDNIKEELKNDKVENKKSKKQTQVVNKGEQNQKKNYMKEAGIKLPENFIKINQEEDSNSSDEFDSDEFEKMIENDDTGDDSDVSDIEDANSDADSDLDESVEEPPKKVKISKKNKNIHTSKVALIQTKKTGKDDTKPVQQKRKAPQKNTSPKKPKFEKQSDRKPLKKQFKKKK